MPRRKAPDMPLTPDEVSKKKFSVVRGRGYNRWEVEQYLALVAGDYSAAIQKIAVAANVGRTTEDDIASEIGELLRAASETARRIKDKARTEADGMMAKAEADARARIEEAEKKRDDLFQWSDAQAKKTIESSERQKSKFVALAQERYGELLEHEKELRLRIDGLEKLVAEMRAKLEPLEQIDLTDDEELFIDVPEADDEVAGFESHEGSRVEVVDP
jgi:DivIVA domain-containing protein